MFPLVHWQTVAVARWLRLRETATRSGPRAFWRAASTPSRRALDTGAKVKDSTRHWFEVSHIDYLRALQTRCSSDAGAGGK